MAACSIEQHLDRLRIPLGGSIFRSGKNIIATNVISKDNVFFLYEYHCLKFKQFLANYIFQVQWTFREINFDTLFQ